MGDFDGFKTLVKEVTIDVVKRARNGIRSLKMWLNCSNLMIKFSWIKSCFLWMNKVAS